MLSKRSASLLVGNGRQRGRNGAFVYVLMLRRVATLYRLDCAHGRFYRAIVFLSASGYEPGLVILRHLRMRLMEGSSCTRTR